jgi:hypothetical protein
MTLHALTVFVAAFLLFQVQPLLSRGILPWFGGSAAVWTTSVLFFQAVLLAGYAYAHFGVRVLGPRRHAVVQLVLLAASLLVLPIHPDAQWKPEGGEEPIARILALLLATVGLPYLVLASTGPLVQAWIARDSLPSAGSPYRLYALGNVGSLLGMACYPLLVEPHLSWSHQAWAWSAGHVLFVLLFALVARRRLRATPVRERARRAAHAGGLGPSCLLACAGLSACASALMLAVTSHLTRDVAPVPLLWVLPLSLYLSSFVLCFASESWYRRDRVLLVFLATGAAMAHVTTLEPEDLPLGAVVVLFSITLFAGCMACHGELARLKPPPEHLTAFYLAVGAGGVAGSAFVALLAPLTFRTTSELGVALVASGGMLLLVTVRHSSRPAWVLGALACAAVGLHLGWSAARSVEGVRLVDRNFYGTLSVSDSGSGRHSLRTLLHGGVSHGAQLLEPTRRREATTYYAPSSGVGLALDACMRRGPVHVGVVGLGTGTLAAYGREGDRLRFYEINPLVVEVAIAQFSFLEDCRAEVEVVLGDARLSMERENAQGFDLLAVDAFSSDAIPVHLLTVEAFGVYFRHLLPDGILAVHVSNKFLELAPVVDLGARALGKRALVVETEDDEDDPAVHGSTWVLVVADWAPVQTRALSAAARPPPSRPGLKPWTDDWSSVLSVLQLG